MEADDRCENLRTGSTQSAAEVQAGERRVNDAVGWVAFIVGIGVAVVGGVLVLTTLWLTLKPSAGLPLKPSD